MSKNKQGYRLPERGGGRLLLTVPKIGPDNYMFFQ
jgi:hypothetical protein